MKVAGVVLVVVYTGLDIHKGSVLKKDSFTRSLSTVGLEVVAAKLISLNLVPGLLMQFCHCCAPLAPSQFWLDEDAHDGR